MKKSAIIESLEWRYATKKFDSAKKVSDEDFNEILEAGRLAPSSFGLQPWKFVVITDPVLRETLKSAAYGQAQVTDASHLVVLTVRTDVDAKYVRTYVEKIAAVRKMSVDALKGFEDMMLGTITRMTVPQVVDWSSRQAYLALGFMLETAALKKIDACPMEGFDAVQCDEILDLKKQNLHALALMTLGYRGEDASAGYAKVRFGADEVILKR